MAISLKHLEKVSFGPLEIEIILPTINQGLSLGLNRAFMMVTMSSKELSEPSVLLVVTPDLVTHGVHGLLHKGDDLGHSVIVRWPKNPKPICSNYLPPCAGSQVSIC